MAVSADTVLKLSLAAGALMAGAGAGYYYAFFLPAQAIHETMDGEQRRAVIVDRERVLERARVDEERRREAAQQRYRSCVSDADLAYQGRWTAACRAQHARQQAAFDDCADDWFRTRKGCAREFPVEPPRGCALPEGIGARLASTRDAAKAQCLGELQGGIHGGA